jgi:hypothetical protein
VSEHYAGSCPPWQHCCLCAEETLRAELAAARAAIEQLGADVREARGAARVLQQALNDKYWQMSRLIKERDAAIQELAAARAALADIAHEAQDVLDSDRNSVRLNAKWVLKKARAAGGGK